jgi:hypothetical protein
MKKRICAIPAAAPAIPVNPKRPAIKARTRKVRAHVNIVISSLNRDVALPQIFFAVNMQMLCQASMPAGGVIGREVEVSDRERSTNHGTSYICSGVADSAV